MKEKSRKLFEKVDDNPGAYFGMLVEGWGDVRDDLDWEDNEWLLGLPDEDGDYVEREKEYLSREEPNRVYESSKTKEVSREEKIKAISSNPAARKMAKELTDKGELPFNSIVDFVYADFFGKDESLKESKSGAKEIAKEIAKQFGINPKIVSAKLGYYRIPTKMLFGDFIEKAKDNGFINTGKKNIFHKDINGATVSVEFDEKNSAIYIDFKYKKDESLKEDKNELSIVGEFETGEDFGQSAGTSKKNQAIFRAKALMKMKGLSRAKVVNTKGNVVWDSDTMLKEDKFVSRDKMSKKGRKELDSQKRNTWGNTNPVTRVQPNKKAYDRKRDNKADLDEELNVGLWSEDSWGSDNPPKNWETIVSKANELIGKYAETHEDDNDIRDYSDRLWNTYCRTGKLPKNTQKKNKKVVDEDIENKDSEEYLGVYEVKRFVNAREKLLDISDSMTTDLRLGRISREDVLYYRNEIKEIYSFLNSLYFGR